MKIFRRKNKEFVDQEKNTPFTGGNTYQTQQALRVQQEIDFNTLRERQNAASDVKGVLAEITAELIDDRNFNEWVLLNFQADYFCGTCRFECDDLEMREKIIKVIRGAFLMGSAGLLKKNGYWIPVYVSSIKEGPDGTISKAQYYELEVALSYLNTLQTLKHDYNFTFANLRNDEELIVFKWGIAALPAFLTIWPFVKFQHSLLKQLISLSFTYNKKMFYTINNKSISKEELKLMFDPANPFIINFGNLDEMRNRFSSEDLANTSMNKDMVEYYNQVVNAYYHIYGRRVNNDIKKERNISSEVEASQENYDVVQSNWLNMFEIFCEKITKASGIQVKFLGNQMLDKESENIENDNPGFNEPEN